MINDNPASSTSPSQPGLEKAQQRRRADSVAKRARITQAIQLAVARGEVPTVSSIARAAGVDRSIFYGERGQTLRTQLNLAVAQLHAELDSGVSLTGRVTAATLRADLATANELNRRLRQQIATLEKQLSHYMGQEILTQLPTLQRSSLTDEHDLRTQIDLLAIRLGELEQENRQLTEDLDGARRANRDLTRQLNAG